jgi:mannitol-1-phosphate 5-dehydrogenase
MKDHVFVGFGFGPIQSGLFAAEAFKSGNFKRIVIAEIDQSLIDALEASGGSYHVNVAGSSGITDVKIDGIEMLNPTDSEQRKQIIDAISEATEIVTSLPSVNFYDFPDGVASTIAAGLKRTTSPGTIIYTAENNNHAAEILSEAVAKYTDIDTDHTQFLNTVIGKMSQVTNDPDFIEAKGIKRIAEGYDRAFLVEEFNRILVTKANLPNLEPGIKVFAEKEDLLPFEEAKLYGHNAIHALLAYLGLEKGYRTMDQLAGDQELMGIARAAFLDESGGTLIRKYADLGDELFTPEGYRAYAEDLLERMTNPYLCDAVDRAARDPQRKLGFTDRLFGTMHLALTYGIEPVNMAKGAKAGVKVLLENESPSAGQIDDALRKLWGDHADQYADKMIEMVS